MFECPGCGGNLKYDIPLQKMKCPFCDNTYDPYSITRETDGVDSYEVNVFTCPQCAGEMLATDNEAAAFCSYCGASTILSSRIANEKRPKYIIPFKINKDDCKKAFVSRVKKNPFSPKEYTKPENVEGFRGIYMPFWMYRMSAKGPVHIEGTTAPVRKGDYIYTDHYDLSADTDHVFNGYSKDASSSFYDDVSEPLLPYNVSELQDFTPSILSGFYADTADVSADAYNRDALDFVAERAYKEFKDRKSISKYSVKEPKDKQKAMHAKIEGIDSAMLPVWFLSYRSGDRVSYAAINGQTGRVSLDCPTDVKKVWIAILIFSIPLYFILNAVLMLIPPYVACFCAVVMEIALVLFSNEMSNIRSRDNHEEDKGILDKLRPKKPKDDVNKSEGDAAESESSAATTVKKSSIYNTCVTIYLILAAVIGFFGQSYYSIQIVSTIAVITGLITEGSARKHEMKKMVLVPRLCSIVGCIAIVIAVSHTFHDYLYYGVGILCMIATIYTMYKAILYSNDLSTRPLPQFDRQGGDDHA